MDKENMVYTYKAKVFTFKTKESLQHLRTKINLEDFMLTAINLSQTDVYYKAPFM